MVCLLVTWILRQLGSGRDNVGVLAGSDATHPVQFGQSKTAVGCCASSHPGVSTSEGIGPELRTGVGGHCTGQGCYVQRPDIRSNSPSVASTRSGFWGAGPMHECAGFRRPNRVLWQMMPWGPPVLQATFDGNPDRLALFINQSISHLYQYAQFYPSKWAMVIAIMAALEGEVAEWVADLH